MLVRFLKIRHRKDTLAFLAIIVLFDTEHLIWSHCGFIQHLKWRVFSSVVVFSIVADMVAAFCICLNFLACLDYVCPKVIISRSCITENQLNFECMYVLILWYPSVRAIHHVSACTECSRWNHSPQWQCEEVQSSLIQFRTFNQRKHIRLGKSGRQLGQIVILEEPGKHLLLHLL